MPVPTSYPGVYVQDTMSNGHSISPVSTSITAFIGRALIGPTDAAGSIFSFADFQRFYGGLAVDYPLSYAVQDFFSNGGSEAVIARLFEPDSKTNDGTATLKFPKCGLTLKAANPGAWGNRLSVTIDTRGITAATAKQFSQYGLTKDDLFNLTATFKNVKGETIQSERYLNLAVKDSGEATNYPNRIEDVLSRESYLLRVFKLSKTPPPNSAKAIGSGGNNGRYLTTEGYLGNEEKQTGLYLLAEQPFNLLCIPPDRRLAPKTTSGMPAPEQDLPAAVRQAAAKYCADRRAFYIVDPLAEWTDKIEQGKSADINAEQLGISGTNKDGIKIDRNAAVYCPRIWQEDSLQNNTLALFAPCGAIAGAIAANDTASGVWKTPAGMSAGLANVAKFDVDIDDAQNGILNPLGINALRTFPVTGSVIWGARTLRGADAFMDDYKYIPVRRLVLFIEESIIQGIKWAVFEPNNEALWSSLRLSITSFLAGLAQQGAFYDYSVFCDATTTTQADIENRAVNIIVQIAVVDPAEFLVISIQQQSA